jgi:hypothetical protein
MACLLPWSALMTDVALLSFDVTREGRNLEDRSIDRCQTLQANLGVERGDPEGCEM